MAKRRNKSLNFIDMHEIVKICQKHGELELREVDKCVDSRYGSIYLRCKICRMEKKGTSFYSLKPLNKTCKIHGRLKKSQIQKIRTRGTIYLRCKLCDSSSSKKSRIKHREEYLSRRSKQSKELYWKYRYTIKDHYLKVKKTLKIKRDNLDDQYIKQLLSDGGLKNDQITKDLIDLKRLQIKLLRGSKENDK